MKDTKNTKESHKEPQRGTKKDKEVLLLNRDEIGPQFPVSSFQFLGCGFIG